MSEKIGMRLKPCRPARGGGPWAVRTSCVGALLVLVCAGRVPAQPCPNAVDYNDPTYGSRIRRLEKPDGHEHNLYHYRDPWSAGNKYMVGIQSDLQQQNWRVVLYDGDGCFLKGLWTLAQYDWRLVWDRHDPNLLYTWKSGNLYRYNVETDEAARLMSFAPLGLSPAGPSVNQAGDRILVLTSDGTFHSYHLPDMQDERAFRPGFPAGCKPGSENKERYIGYKNYIVTRCSPSGGPSTMYIYDDTGVLFHQFDGLGHGHADFSPDGQFAYPKMPASEGPRGNAIWSPLEVHVVNIDGTNDRVLYSVPRSQTMHVQNFHITWPKGVNDWFVVSLFPFSQTSSYTPPMDEIMKVSVDGTIEFLARSGTGNTSDMFWAQPLASPSSDGTRIGFNSNRSGTIDQYILFPLLITSASHLPDGQVGKAYEQTLAATGGTTPYTWSLIAGALPAGIAFSPSGLLSGQPTEAGIVSFVARVIDNAGVRTSERFSLTITPP